ncbi:hypothetical protein NIES208_00555 [[Limnothrix rosea] IAM M-220]|nr:hypothetical protein NIES208_00555 [[Limnothrix rosea] IAM M-220]
MSLKSGLKLLLGSLLLLSVTFIEPNVTLKFNQVAQAAPLSQATFLLEVPSPSDMLDKVTNSSASKRVEGTADRVVGRAKRDIGEVSSEVSGLSEKAEGLAQEAKGKAKQDVAKVQEKLEKSANSLKDLSEDMVDSIKDAF